MQHTTKTLVLSFTGLTLLATLALAQGSAEGRGRGAEARRDHTARFERGELRAERFDEARRFARELEFTDTQRDLARQEAQALAPAARAARDEVRAIRDAARTRARDGDAAAARTEARLQLGSLRERTRTVFAPHGRALIQSLSPEQRARIEARLAARGKTFDVERASERVGRWLARPHAEKRHGNATRHAR